MRVLLARVRRFGDDAVIRHRLILTAEAELDELKPDQLIHQTLSKIPVPR